MEATSHFLLYKSESHCKCPHFQFFSDWCLFDAVRFVGTQLVSKIFVKFFVQKIPVREAYSGTNQGILVPLCLGKQTFVMWNNLTISYNFLHISRLRLQIATLFFAVFKECLEKYFFLSGSWIIMNHYQTLLLWSIFHFWWLLCFCPRSPLLFAAYMHLLKQFACLYFSWTTMRSAGRFWFQFWLAYFGMCFYGLASWTAACTCFLAVAGNQTTAASSCESLDTPWGIHDSVL